MADGDDARAFADAIEAALDGPFTVDAPTARARLVEAIGERAVASQAIAVYEDANGTLAEPRRDPIREAQSDDLVAVAGASPRILLATGRDQALQLVADLPADLQRTLTLVVPAPRDEVAAGAAAPPLPAFEVRVVDADPVLPPRTRPHGRSPLTRIRAAMWRPTPTGEDLLVKALLEAARRTRTGREPVEIVAIDAPAAAILARQDARLVRLAPGALRWLADRWSVPP